MIEWSPKQKQVIDLRGSDLLVSAAAGSGKTAVLVERIIGLIVNDGVSLDELMVMTFTKAAAAEMRVRVEKALKDRIREDPGNRRLKLQLTILPRARISTIDSICQTIIKEYYQYLDIDPSFRVGDEGELKVLRADIFNEILTEEYEKAEPEFMRLADAFSKRESDKRLFDAVETLFSVSQSEVWPGEYLEGMLRDCERDSAGDIESSLWFKEMLSAVRADVTDHRELLRAAKRLCRMPDGPGKYEPAIDFCLEKTEEILKADSYTGLRNIAGSMVFPKLSTVTAKDQTDPAKKELVKKIRDGFRKYIQEYLVKNLLLLPESLLIKTEVGSAAVNKELIRLTIRFSESYAERKREQNIVDFGDMEHFTLKLLYEKDENGGRRFSRLADELAAGFKEIMVDEYQDSNGVQEAILEALNAERFGRPDVFMVGDVKQSIYRFRHSDPRIFMDKYESFTAAGEPEPSRGLPEQEGVLKRKIELNANYRSRPEVIDSVNAVFDRIMRKDTGGVEYAGESRLYAKAVYPGVRPVNEGEPGTGAGTGNPYRTEILIADTKAAAETGKSGGAGPEGPGDDALSAEEAEYHMIARRIREMIYPDDPGKAMMVRDEKGDGLRRAGFGDITILLRAANGHAEKLVDILAENGVPAYFGSSRGYFSSREVEIVMSFLNIIDNPRQDIPLAAVMRSPVFGFTDEELARIKAGYKDHEGPDFWDAVKFAAGEDEKTRGFVEAVSIYREKADIEPVHILINRFYTETGYYNYVSAMPLGKIRRKNLDALLDRAEKYAATGLKGLFNFARYIEALKKNEFDYGEAPRSAEDNDIVKIMTIHGSKGLEFPIVFLARAAGDNRNADDGVIIDGELGAASDYLDPETSVRYPSPKKELIKLREKREDAGEELRLLYVAMTRAKEKLIITGVKDSLKGGSAARRLETAVNEADLLLECLEEGGGGETGGAQEPGEAPEASEHAGAPERTSDSPGKLPRLWILNAGRMLDRVLLGAGSGCFDIRVFTRDDLTKAEAGETVRESSLEDRLRDIREGVLARRAGESGSGSAAAADNRTGTGSNGFAGYLENIFHARYEFTEETRLRPKVSVSEIRESAEADFDDASSEYDGESPRPEGKGGAQRGTAFHRAMQLLPFLPDVSDNIDYLRDCGLMPAEEFDILDKRAVRNFLLSDLGKKFSMAYHNGRLKRERRFMAGIPARELIEGQDSGETQLLQGIIDAYIEEEDGSLTIVDYKTDRVKSGRELTDRYSLQLRLYGRALSQLTGKKVKKLLIYSTYLNDAAEIEANDLSLTGAASAGESPDGASPGVESSAGAFPGGADRDLPQTKKA